MSQLPASKIGGGTKSAQDTTAAQITTTITPCNGVFVQNDPDNTVDLLVGNATAQPIQLAPGDGTWIGIDDASKVYTKAVSSTANVNYLTLETRA
jgi:hypothetical protein